MRIQSSPLDRASLPRLGALFQLWLTLATFLGYAVLYTAVLKPATPRPRRRLNAR